MHGVDFEITGAMKAGLVIVYDLDIRVHQPEFYRNYGFRLSDTGLGLFSEEPTREHLG